MSLDNLRMFKFGLPRGRLRDQDVMSALIWEVKWEGGGEGTYNTGARRCPAGHHTHASLHQQLHLPESPDPFHSFSPLLGIVHAQPSPAGEGAGKTGKGCRSRMPWG